MSFKTWEQVYMLWVEVQLFALRRMKAYVDIHVNNGKVNFVCCVYMWMIFFCFSTKQLVS